MQDSRNLLVVAGTQNAYQSDSDSSKAATCASVYATVHPASSSSSSSASSSSKGSAAAPPAYINPIALDLFLARSVDAKLSTDGTQHPPPSTTLFYGESITNSFSFIPL